MQSPSISNKVRLGSGMLLLIIASMIWGQHGTRLEARIAVYGDTRGAETVHASVVNAISKLEPELVFHTGDLTSQGRSAQDFETFKDIIRPLEGAEFYPVRGNHERDEQLFLSSFPQLGGSTRHVLERDSLIFIVLDSTHELKPGSPQTAWLTEQLEAAKSHPVILIMHHPVFSSGAHGDELELGDWLPYLLEGSSVKAVISGHEHSYERSEFQGIQYLVSGGGGAPFRDKRKANPHSLVYVQTHHFIILERSGTSLLGFVYDPELNLQDCFQIEL